MRLTEFFFRICKQQVINQTLSSVAKQPPHQQQQQQQPPQQQQVIQQQQQQQIQLAQSPQPQTVQLATAQGSQVVTLTQPTVTLGATGQLQVPFEKKKKQTHTPTLFLELQDGVFDGAKDEM